AVERTGRARRRTGTDGRADGAHRWTFDAAARPMPADPGRLGPAGASGGLGGRGASDERTGVVGDGLLEVDHGAGLGFGRESDPVDEGLHELDAPALLGGDIGPLQAVGRRVE